MCLFAKAVAMECAAADEVIRINTHPAGHLHVDLDENTNLHRKRLTFDPMRWLEPASLGKVGQAQDIANGVLFLASEASGYITGSELVIDGGMTGGTRPSWSLD